MMTDKPFDPLDLLDEPCTLSCTRRVPECITNRKSIPMRQCVDGETFGRLFPEYKEVKNAESG